MECGIRLLTLLLVGFAFAVPKGVAPKSEIEQLRAQVKSQQNRIAYLQKALDKARSDLREERKKNRKLVATLGKTQKPSTNPPQARRNARRYSKRRNVARSKPNPARLKEPLKIGQVGHIEGVTILQIQDAQNALVEFQIVPPVFGSASRDLGNGQVIGWPVKTHPGRKKVVWLTEFDTSGLADGQYVGLLGPVKITGTRSYETITGKRTVFVLQF